MTQKKTFILLLVLFSLLASAPYEELVPDFDRMKSPVMIRKIERPTLANLDYAAYSANPIRYDSEKYKPKKPPKRPSIVDMVFNNALKGAVNSLKETPLKDREKQQAMAWAPLQNLLWSELKVDAIARIGSKIIAQKWADPDIFKPYQDIAAVYLHNADEKIQIWVKVEFSPWVKFLEGITDDDGDGFKEVYGRLNLESVDDKTKEKVITWIQTVYLRRELNREEIVDWANVLASYWYPTLNTDIIDMTGYKQWPTKETEIKICKKIKDMVVENPIAVIRGVPHDKPLYNVFVVERIGEKKDEPTSKKSVNIPKKIMDTTVSENFITNAKRFTNELKPYGDYAAWYESNKKITSRLKETLAGLPEQQMGIQGKEGWLFFRHSLDYIIAEDLTGQEEDKNPIPRLIEFKQYLDSLDVNLLFIAVPTKAEIYYEHLGVSALKDSNNSINPYGRKILHDLQIAGIEVIDLLPHFLRAKEENEESGEKIFQLQDTHWTNRGLQITAGLVADRIKKYTWYGKYAQEKIEYLIEDTTFLRAGDIVERLPEMEKAKYQPVTLRAQQVKTQDGNRYKGNRNAPIMLIGDSFTGVFELVDCKSAGIGSHIAAKTGLPVDIITSWGGGPLVRNKMIRARKDDMGVKRLVVYVMAARDLYNYKQGWEKLKLNRK